jgi:hypothetical protein
LVSTPKSYAVSGLYATLVSLKASLS